MVCARICVCEYCTHTQNKHIDAIYYHYECLSLCKTFDRLSLYNLWSAYCTFSLSLFLFVMSQLQRSRCLFLCLPFRSLLPSQLAPSFPCLFVPPPTLPTYLCYLHSLTSPFLFSCLPTCPQTGHMPTWHQVYLTALYPQQSSSKRYLNKARSLTHSFTNTLSSSSSQWTTPVEGGVDS